jgi:hypothetical protein
MAFISAKENDNEHGLFFSEFGKNISLKFGLKNNFKKEMNISMIYLLTKGIFFF